MCLDVLTAVSVIQRAIIPSLKAIVVYYFENHMQVQMTVHD